MPHVTIEFSNDLNLNLENLFHDIEKTISQHDASAGKCKCRSYPASEYLHTQLFVQIRVLKKAHRDTDFMTALLASVTDIVIAQLPEDCYYSIDLDFVSDFYVTAKV